MSDALSSDKQLCRPPKPSEKDNYSSVANDFVEAESELLLLFLLFVLLLPKGVKEDSDIAMERL